MIFQYCVSVSEHDSKRHYVWKCTSEEDPATWIFLTPDGNRFCEMTDSSILPNTMTIRHLIDQNSTAQSDFRDIQYRDECERLLKKYPMFGKIRVMPPVEDPTRIRISNVFRVGEHNRGCEELEHETLLLLLNELQSDIVSMERQMFLCDRKFRRESIDIQFKTEWAQLAGRLELVDWIDAFSKLTAGTPTPKVVRQPQPVTLLNAGNGAPMSLKRDRDAPTHYPHAKKTKFM